MTDDDKIPLLEELIVAGHQAETDSVALDTDENQAVEIEAEEDTSAAPIENEETQARIHRGNEEIDANPSVQELIVDEEIRQILEKHMENAYEEIIRLLNRKIC